MKAQDARLSPAGRGCRGRDGGCGRRRRIRNTAGRFRFLRLDLSQRLCGHLRAARPVGNLGFRVVGRLGFRTLDLPDLVAARRGHVRGAGRGVGQRLLDSVILLSLEGVVGHGVLLFERVRRPGVLRACGRDLAEISQRGVAPTAAPGLRLPRPFPCDDIPELFHRRVSFIQPGLREGRP